MKNEYEGVKYEPTITNMKKQTGKIKEPTSGKTGYIVLFAALLIVTLSIVILTVNKISKNNYDGKLSPGSSATANETNYNYDTKTLGVIKEIDGAKSTVTFYDIKKDADQTLQYDESADLLSKYDDALTMDQIEIGEIADLYYDSNPKKLEKLKISSEAWEYKGVKNLVVNQASKTMSITNSKFKYQDSLVIANDKNLVSLMDINEKDDLIVKGYDKQIYSIIVDKGHGYIRLKNYEDFVGGTVEVGRDIIMPVVDDMLIVASEGSYKLTMTNGTFVGSKTINVLRDKEIVVDMGEFLKPADKTSSVDFNISPDGAFLYINGKITDYEKAVQLKYGEYQVEVKLSGYNTYTGVLTVDSPGMNISVDLVQKKASDSNSNSSKTNQNTTNNSTNKTNNQNNQNSNNQNNTTAEQNNDTNTNADSDNETDSNVSTTPTPSPSSSVDSKHKITVQGPVGAKVYFDGILKGTAPVSFEKVIGSHVVSLTKSGYINKSYTVEVMDDSENVVFNFPEMALSIN